MTKVKVLETPTQKIVERKTLSHEFIATDGSKIVLKKPTLLAQYDLNRALGQDSSVQACVNIASVLLFIDSIDGEKFRMPQSSKEVRASLDKLSMELVTDIFSELAASGMVEVPGDEENNFPGRDEVKK